MLEYMATGEIAFLERLRERYPEGLLDGHAPARDGTQEDPPGLGVGRRRRPPGPRAGLPRGPHPRDPRHGREDRGQAAARHRGLDGPGRRRGASSAACAPRSNPRRPAWWRRCAPCPWSPPPTTPAACAGCRATVRDIDLVAASTDPAAVMDAFAALPEVAQVDERGETKLVAKTHTGLGVDLRIVPPESYGNLLQHFTGSADHNVALRGHAQRRGYKISEYHVEHLESGRLDHLRHRGRGVRAGGPELHPARVAGEPGGDRGGRSRIAPGPDRAPRPAGRPARALRLDRRPRHPGTDGPRRPGRGAWTTSASATTPSRWP